MNEPPRQVQERLARAARLRIELGEALAGVREIASDLRLAEFASDIGETDELRPRDIRAPWIDEVVSELNTVLEDSGLQGHPPDLAEEELWVIDTARVRGAPRSILRGYVEPVLALPVVARMPDLVVYYLTIDGEDDLLKREKHSHFGWHYHYMNWKKERSDRILCWDLRATRQAGEIAALFHEPHAEGGGFTSRPDRWGPRKRESMHHACRPDLDRWPPGAFKQASNDAVVVWPLGRALSERPPANAKRRSR